MSIRGTKRAEELRRMMLMSAQEAGRDSLRISLRRIALFQGTDRLSCT